MTVPRLPVYVDVDDVLADTTAKLIELARDLFGVEARFEACHSFDLGESFGLSERQRDQLLDAAHGDEVVRSMSVVAGAVPALQRLRDAGREIHVVTGRPPSTLRPTREWLTAAGVPFQRLDSVDKYGRQTHLAESVPLESFVGRRFGFAVEDSLDMARFLVERAETPVLLLDKPWNREGLEPDLASRIRRVRSWEEIEQWVRAGSS